MYDKLPKKMLYALAKEVCGKTLLTDLNDAEKHAMAIKLYERHYIHGCSSFEDHPTYGYGEMDSYGFFEYPLYEKDIKPGLNKLRIQNKETADVS